MKTIYYIYRLYLLLFVFLAIGCTENDPFGSSENGKYKSVISFNIAQSLTRSNVAPEDEVRKVDVMLFREGVLEKVMRNITSFENVGEHSSITVSFETEGVRKAYIVANNDDNAWLDALEINKTTIEDVASFSTAILEKMSNPPLVMYGISDDISFSAGQNSVLCNLYRLVAKIDVNSKASTFKLNSARLLKSKVSANIFPGEVPLVANTKDFDAVEIANNHVFLYTYENAQNTKDATSVEIKGKVNGAMLTDTIHFVVDGKPLPIERNYLYTININEVQKNNLVALIDVKPWNIGDDIDEVVSGNKPVVDILADPLVGTYSSTDSTLTLKGGGGEIAVHIKSNADCDIQFPENWIKQSPITRAASFIENSYNLSVAPNDTPVERTGVIKVINKISNLSQSILVKQASGVIVADKYMVLVVAGQSNAVGYDQSRVDAEDLRTPQRALQLSYRNGSAPKQNLSVIPLSWCADDVDARKRQKANDSGQFGLKGIHLPLAKELLKHIPADYNVVIVPVAYASSRFASASGTDYGTYNSTLMHPENMTVYSRWGEQGAYVNTIVDRVKYLLNLDPGNKFLGVVWCQGENDSKNSDYHYTEFTKMADKILTNLNNGYGSRSTYGTIDKRSWYTYSSCPYWVDWYSPEDASAVFGGYKAWNPDTYIHSPSYLSANPPGGPGMGKYHFGENSFYEIARMTVERMNQNGLLFNNAPRTSGHFTDKTTPAQAAAQGGSISDSDLSSSLIVMAYFNNSITEKTGSPAIMPSNMSLVAAEGLKDIDGRPRNRNALRISPQGGYVRVRNIPAVTNWSISFMFKRTGGFEADIQSILSPQSSNDPFVGFRKYSSVMGVAKAAEFVVEPTYANTKSKSVAGLFMSADNVRSLDEWIHYTITYNYVTKETSIYMNGDLVQQAIIANASVVNLGNIYLGNTTASMPAATGQLMDFGVWKTVLTPASIRKLFLMSYYGFTK